MITLEQWITASGKYQDRLKSSELTEEVRTNAERLLKAVNALLSDLGWKGVVSVSSGFRPSTVNSKIAGAAKRSAHMTGLAVDIADPKGQLGRRIREDGGALLRKHGLFMEAIESTKTWVHLDLVPRKDRPSREFHP